MALYPLDTVWNLSTPGLKISTHMRNDWKNGLFTPLQMTINGVPGGCVCVFGHMTLFREHYCLSQMVSLHNIRLSWGGGGVGNMTQGGV